VKDTRTPLHAAVGAAVTHITLTPLFILGEWVCNSQAGAV
jgi:Na+-driven multidrug efflux pump